jgi:peptidoglycan hydrolase-like protein with peptidoglycan-binding domain
MIKNEYEKELVISATQRRDGADNTRKDVKKIQSWLALYGMTHPTAGTTTTVDGDFGPATEQCVKNFQKAMGLPQSGVVNQQLFDSLCDPMHIAYEKPLTASGLRTLVVQAANQHLNNSPFELNYDDNSNMGPWVRSYMDANEGTDWFWCMGFVQTIIDQAASTQNKDFRAMMPLTYSCDTVGMHGLNSGALIRYTAVRNDPTLVRPGDIFLLQKSSNDWIHTGIVTVVGTDTFETIEGNTNEGGSNNGNGVYKRIRNFRKKKLDVFSIEGLV